MAYLIVIGLFSSTNSNIYGCLINKSFSPFNNLNGSTLVLSGCERPKLVNLTVQVESITTELVSILPWILPHLVSKNERPSNICVIMTVDNDLSFFI